MDDLDIISENERHKIECYDELLKACKEAEIAIHEALGDLTDHFTVKHVKGYLETIEEAINKAEGK